MKKHNKEKQENPILKRIRYYQGSIKDFETFWKEKENESKSGSNIDRDDIRKKNDDLNKSFNIVKVDENTDNHKFNKCLMVYYEPSDEIIELQKNIEKEDLQDDDYKSLETEQHTTILYGLRDDVSIDNIKKLVLPLENYETICYGLSLFENEKFDVLKMTAHNDSLFKTNEKIRNNCEYKNDYPDYKPHITIAYLKSGVGKKYLEKKFKKKIIMKPLKFVLSTEIDGTFVHDEWI